MRTLLVGLLLLGQSTANQVGTPGSREVITSTLPTADYECIAALKDSHEASRAAWGRSAAWSWSMTTVISSLTVCTDGTTLACEDQCGIVDSADWHECKAKELREAERKNKEHLARIDRAHAALDKVDRVCGLGKK